MNITAVIGPVQDLTVLPLGQSTLQVSWTPPSILRGEEEVYNIVYYVTVGGVPSGGSSLETHKFTVSNSVRPYQSVYLIEVDNKIREKQLSVS